MSADSSPLGVKGRVNLNIVFSGLQCDMWVCGGRYRDGWIIGHGSTAFEFAHQLDLHTGQLRADGRPTLQLHQQHSPRWLAVL